MSMLELWRKIRYKSIDYYKRKANIVKLFSEEFYEIQEELYFINSTETMTLLHKLYKNDVVTSCYESISSKEEIETSEIESYSHIQKMNTEEIDTIQQQE